MSTPETPTTTIEKIKHHFQENWKYYAVAAGGAITTAALIALFKKNPTGFGNLFNYGQINNNHVSNVTTITGTIADTGRPPYAVHNITKNVWYTSQTEAALIEGMSSDKMSKILRGVTNASSGDKFARYAKM